MIVVCPSCSARFQYDEARFQGVPYKRFRCPKCNHVFQAANPSHGAPPASEPPAPIPVTAPLSAPTVAFDAASFAQRASGGGSQEVTNPPMPAYAPDIPPPLPNDGLSGQETTARRDRDAFLASVGVGSANLPNDMKFSLAYLSGPKASTVKVLDKPQTLIGREDGDIITKDPETSRRHSMIEIHSDGTVWLTDLGSTNGTFVDGIQIFGTIQIMNRQEFTCGKSTFMLLVRKDDALTMD
jgi:predicted Zn finger-like uncharacterized protein